MKWKENVQQLMTDTHEDVKQNAWTMVASLSAYKTTRHIITNEFKATIPSVWMCSGHSSGRPFSYFKFLSLNIMQLEKCQAYLT